MENKTRLRTLTWITLLAALAFFHFPKRVEGHSHWIYPPPRINENIKISPCGGVLPGAYGDTVTAGESTLVRWNEFVDHSGYFTIYLSTDGDKTFQQLFKQNDSLVNAIWTRKILVPASAKAGRATFQLVQTMTDAQPYTYYHSCADILIQLPVGVESGAGGVFAEAQIAVSPNPFNPTTVVSYQLPTASAVRLDLYNLAGKHIKTLANGWKERGDYKVGWNAEGMASGVYVFRLKAGGMETVKWGMLLK